LHINWSGEKIYDYEGSNSDNMVAFDVIIKDSEGYIVERHSEYSYSYIVGDKIRVTDKNIAKLKPTESYTIEITDYSL